MAYPEVKATEIPEVANYVKSLTGIVLDASKSYLIQSRLGPLCVLNKVASYAELCKMARSQNKLQLELIDAISTNETSFYRDKSPFELLKAKLLPDILKRMNGTKQPIAIWSAASSTGQEVYSIAFSIYEKMPNMHDYYIKILGTDISDAAVRAASYAYFTDLELGRGMSPEKRHSYFTQEGGRWKVKDEFRALASFQRLNLLENIDHLPKFDIIFCRNVAIYFDMDQRRKLYTSLSRRLKPEGVLVIGSTESLAFASDLFDRHEHERAVYYTRK